MATERSHLQGLGGRSSLLFALGAARTSLRNRAKRTVPAASDDRVFFEGLSTGRGKGGGVDTELHFWAVFWFEDGTVAKRQVFWSRDEALEAAGLSR